MQVQSQEPPPGSLQEPQAQEGLVQHPSLGAMAGIMPPGKLVTTRNVAETGKYRGKCGITTW